MKIPKGSYGYLAAERKKAVLYAVILLAAVLVIYFGAYFYFKTNQNYFSILAALVCLPAARFIVNMIMYLRAKGCSSRAQAQISAHAQGLPQAYDLYFTSERKNLQASHTALAPGTVIVYSEDPKADVKEGENHLKRLMLQNGIHGYTVKIFTDLQKYTDRLDQMQDLGRMNRAESDKILSLFYNISL